MTQAVPFDLIAFFVATFLGALVAGVAGFAFGLIASAVWLHVIAPAQSAALIAAFAILIQGATLWNLRHALQVSRLIPFIVGGAIGIPLGAAVLNWATPTQMRAFIGLALIVFSLYSLVRPKLPSVQGGRAADGIVGILSGLFAGGTVGARSLKAGCCVGSGSPRTAGCSRMLADRQGRIKPRRFYLDGNCSEHQ